MRVLVCGGAGYIGSNMTAMLAAQGHEPIVFDDLSKGHRSAVQKAEFIQGNLADYDLLVSTLAQRYVEAVMHFAAFIEVGESVELPLKYYRNNLCCTENLLSAMETAGVGKLVFSSTAAVYGVPRDVPITEDSPTEPINPYGFTKLVVEHILADYAAAYGLGYAALRYFNAAGADSSGHHGEDHDPESHLIPIVLEVALGRRESITTRLPTRGRSRLSFTRPSSVAASSSWMRPVSGSIS